MRTDLRTWTSSGLEKPLLMRHHYCIYVRCSENMGSTSCFQALLITFAVPP
jgi:hypothetical protein